MPAVIEPIGEEEFRRRLESMVLGGVGPALPRRERDVRILLKAVSLALDRGRNYSEPDLNQALRAWTGFVGPRVDLDPVTIRRALVDRSYVIRDPAGRAYELRGSDPGEFAPQVDRLDPIALVAEARERSRLRAEARKRLSP